jgi:competence CoiA-like predicted nuclease
MQFALIDGIKSLPSKNGLGNCPLCNADVIARCGNIKVHHWAHKSKKVCDPWWENETQWHRDWKKHFPSEWHEIIHFDELGEKHIADLKTPNGLVVEFQHSSIGSEEKLSRENFYKTMVWIVDGNRRKKDKKRFDLGSKYFIPSKRRETYFVPEPNKAFPNEWTDSKSFVFFDFGKNDNGIHFIYFLYKPHNAKHYQCTRIDKYKTVSLIQTGELIGLINTPSEMKQQPAAKLNKPSQWVYHRGRLIKKRRF